MATPSSAAFRLTHVLRGEPETREIDQPCVVLGRNADCDLVMRRWLEERGLRGPRDEPIRMRVGIHSGPVVAGDIGSPLRKDYTVVGDTVNIASRLQSSVARPGQIVVGQTTHDLAQGRFEFEPLPEIRLNGKEQMVRPYLVVGPLPDSTGEFSQTIGAVR